MNRCFDDGIFKRRNDADVREIALVIGIANGIVLAERFEHDLVGDGAIKDYCCAFAPGFGGFENAARNVLREEMPKMCFAVGGADKGAVVDDHGERTIELLGDGHGEIVAAAGNEGDLDAPPSGFRDGRAVGVRELPPAVEERAVDVQSDEADRHGVYFSVNRGARSPVLKGSSPKL